MLLRGRFVGVKQMSSNNMEQVNIVRTLMKYIADVILLAGFNFLFLCISYAVRTWSRDACCIPALFGKTVRMFR